MYDSNSFTTIVQLMMQHCIHPRPHYTSALRSSAVKPTNQRRGKLDC